MSIENIKNGVEAGKQVFSDMPAGPFLESWNKIQADEADAAVAGVSTILHELKLHTKSAVSRAAELAREGERGTKLFEDATAGATSTDHANLISSAQGTASMAHGAHERLVTLANLADTMHEQIAAIAPVMDEFMALYAETAGQDLPNSLAVMPTQVVQHANEYLDNLG